MTNFVPTSIIKVAKKATNPAKDGTLRFKRLEIMRQCNGMTVTEFYKACNAKVPGSVSKKLLAVAISKGFATVTTSEGKAALAGKELTKYDTYAKRSRANAKADA